MCWIYAPIFGSKYARVWNPVKMSFYLFLARLDKYKKMENSSPVMGLKTDSEEILLVSDPNYHEHLSQALDLL